MKPEQERLTKAIDSWGKAKAAEWFCSELIHDHEHLLDILSLRFSPPSAAIATIFPFDHHNAVHRCFTQMTMYRDVLIAHNLACCPKATKVIQWLDVNNAESLIASVDWQTQSPERFS